MVLDEPDDGDYELEIDGIKVYYCDEVTTLAKSLVIDYKSSFFRKKFFVEQIE